MKQLILLFTALTLMFTSCEKDDDNNNDNQDPIIGTWTYYKSYSNGVEIPLDACEKQSQWNFTEDGNYSETWVQSADETTCETDIDNGTWKNLGNGEYQLTNDVEVWPIDFTFEGNTFYYEYTEEIDGIIYNDKEVYIRN